MLVSEGGVGGLGVPTLSGVPRRQISFPFDSEVQTTLVVVVWSASMRMPSWM